jgi:hypothetical protein
MEVNGTAQTAGDLAAAIAAIEAGTGATKAEVIAAILALIK